MDYAEDSGWSSERERRSASVLAIARDAKRFSFTRRARQATRDYTRFQ
jgi:hypothetical protein